MDNVEQSIDTILNSLNPDELQNGKISLGYTYWFEEGSYGEIFNATKDEIDEEEVIAAVKVLSPHIIYGYLEEGDQKLELPEGFNHIAIRCEHESNFIVFCDDERVLNLFDVD